MDVLTNEHIVTSTYEEERGKPMPSKKHAAIQSNISGLLFPYRKQIKVFSELNLIINGKKHVPDVAIYPEGVLDMEDEDEINVEVMPLTAVEILSPKQAFNELLDKAKRYFDAGVKSYWLVVPELKAIFVYTSKKDYIFFDKAMNLKDEILDVEISLEEVFG